MRETPPILRCGRYRLDLSQPRVMGVLNVTPDSFSDGGRFLDVDRALAHAREMLSDGADIIDIGGESTRPGAQPTTEADEIRRVVPIVESLAHDDVVISVDTMKPAVMRAAISAGASMINDARALRAPDALDIVAKSDVAVCLMHMQGEPRTMQSAPVYSDVVAEVRRFLEERVVACRSAGIADRRIAVDPGFGFGKAVAHNLRLVRELASIGSLGFPIVAGLSRKSTLGALTGRSADDRLAASIAAALSAVMHGASIVRVHDVRETVDALKVWLAIEKGNEATT
jgi:dihydropteroate synthase